MKNEIARPTLPLLAVLCAVPLLLGPAAGLTAAERQERLGGEERWEGLAERRGVVLVSGRWGEMDLVLQDAEYRPGADTDLLLHFNGSPAADAAGRYRSAAPEVLISRQVARFGGGSAGFQAKGLLLEPGPGALFAPGAVWGDFSIEFWLYPATLEDGEVVLAWGGARWEQGRIAAQSLQAAVRGRVLDWRFENLFSRPVAVRGITPLVPRVWHHHLLRWDSSRGVLEYLVDGVPEGVTYTTSTGREGGELAAPQIGGAGASELRVAPSCTGFIDELRVSRRFVADPALTRYAGETGYGMSRLFDLGYTGTRLRRIEAVDRLAGDSAVLYSYRLADRLSVGAPGDGTGPLAPAAPWVPFRPGRELPPGPGGEPPRGRWLQVRVELFPDGTRSLSPEVSELRIAFEPDLPPVAPAGLIAEPADGRIRLLWKRANEADVRGYRVYYGESPGNYHGTGSDQGDSPVDVGDAIELTLTGLRNQRLYYFAVVSYDATDPPHQSPFSREISARPSRLSP